MYLLQFTYSNKNMINKYLNYIKYKLSKTMMITKKSHFEKYIDKIVVC